MIIARGQTENGGELVILGLSRENVRRLTSGQPMRLTQKSHGKGVPEGWEIAIIFGETEIEMGQKLEREGVVGVSTKVHVDPRLGN